MEHQQIIVLSNTATYNRNPHGLRANTHTMTKNEASKIIGNVISGTNAGKLTKDEAKAGKKIKHSKFGVGTIILDFTIRR